MEFPKSDACVTKDPNNGDDETAIIIIESEYQYMNTTFFIDGIPWQTANNANKTVKHTPKL